MIIIEFDLAGAEWVVTAYLSRDSNMIGVVKSGKSPHIITGALTSGIPEELVLAEHYAVGTMTDPDELRSMRSEHVPQLMEYVSKNACFLPRSMSIRQSGKKQNYGLNYGMQYRRFALEYEVPETDARPMVEAYSTVAYPGLKQNYWQETRDELRKNKRVLDNCFGRRVCLRGEWGNDLFMAAYSFKPQSTVADITLEAMCRIYEDDTKDFEVVYLGAQVHDSLMTIHPTPSDEDGWIVLATKCYKIIHDYMSPTLHYEGEDFILGVDMKIGQNWGDMHTINTKQSIIGIANDLRKTVSAFEDPDADLSAEQLAALAESEGLEEEAEKPYPPEDRPSAEAELMGQ